MTRKWRWAIEGGSGLVLAAVGYFAGGNSGGKLLALIGLIGGPFIVGKLLSIGQTVSDQIREVEALPPTPRRRLSAADLEMTVAVDPVTRELVPELVQAVPAKLSPGERLADAAVARTSGGPGLLAVTDRRVMFMRSDEPDQVEEVGFAEV